MIQCPPIKVVSGMIKYWLNVKLICNETIEIMHLIDESMADDLPQDEIDSMMMELLDMQHYLKDTIDYFVFEERTENLEEDWENYFLVFENLISYSEKMIYYWRSKYPKVILHVTPIRLRHVKMIILRAP